MEKISCIRRRNPKLKPAICETGSGERQYTDHYIGGVTYRVWSIFSDNENASTVDDHLTNLMTRQFESGIDVGDTHDEYAETIERKNQAACQTVCGERTTHIVKITRRDIQQFSRKYAKGKKQEPESID